jgi:CheY-like chemotaxis protein
MAILVADDDAAIRKVISKMLTEEGYEVLEASDGIEVTKLLTSQVGIDLVILDIIMPEKEGLETIRELKQFYPKVKILAISGGGAGNLHQYLTIAKKMGADQTLSKPFLKNDLLSTVQRILAPST